MTPLTRAEREELARLHEEATKASSRSWTCSDPREDGTCQVYSPSLGPLRKIVPVAETLEDFGPLIAAMFNALPKLLAELEPTE